MSLEPKNPDESAVLFIFLIIKPIAIFFYNKVDVRGSLFCLAMLFDDDMDLDVELENHIN
jgi:hypothetical protein